MIDIILLLFLTPKIGRLAEKKGLPAGQWKLKFILLWIGLEFAGLITAVLIFGPDNFFSIGLVSLAFALASYFITERNLSKLPDMF